MVAACPGIRLSRVPDELLPGELRFDPLGLEEEQAPDAILLTPQWYLQAAASGADVAALWRRLESHCPFIVGLDGHDSFRLWLPADVMDRLAVVLKAQGVYRDRELYNFDVGAIFTPGPDGGLVRSRRAFSARNLDKVRLSLPCFVANVPWMRAMARRQVYRMSYAQRLGRRLGDLAIEADARILGALLPRAGLIHCLVTITHVARVDILERLLEAEVAGCYGGVVADSRIGGALPAGSPASDECDADGFFGKRFSDGELLGLARRLEGRGLLRTGIGRFRFSHSVLRQAAVLAPPGYGELTTRHADAWTHRRALICPSLAHVDTMFPFADRENVLFCREDMRDVVAILREIEAGGVDAAAIGRMGGTDWRRWSNDIEGLLVAGVYTPIASALFVPSEAR